MEDVNILNVIGKNLKNKCYIIYSKSFVYIFWIEILKFETETTKCIIIFIQFKSCLDINNFYFNFFLISCCT